MKEKKRMELENSFSSQPTFIVLYINRKSIRTATISYFYDWIFIQFYRRFFQMERCASFIVKDKEKKKKTIESGDLNSRVFSGGVSNRCDNGRYNVFRLSEQCKNRIRERLIGWRRVDAASAFPFQIRNCLPQWSRVFVLCHGRGSCMKQCQHCVRGVYVRDASSRASHLSIV